ncbi:MAG: hypothetical protein QOK17_2229 [Sphingomonadales bacterium]|jgi:hypothetical protein|nr:hypothetical protein [Sphingomonadales bacterium]
MTSSTAFARRGPLPWLAAAAASTLAVELALAIRRADIFGFGAVRFDVIDRPSELALFAAALVASHLLLLWLAWAGARRIVRPRGKGLFPLDFLACYLLVYAASAAAREKVAAYLGNQVSLQLIRQLGGGSLLDAAAYALREAVLILLLLAAVLSAWLVVRRRLRRHGVALASKPGAPWPVAVALLVAAPALLAVAAIRTDVRAGLDRFTAPWLLYAALDAATDFDRDGYSFFSRQRDPRQFDAAVHPFGLDVPGDGVDEDGFAGDYREAPEPPLPPPRFGALKRNVVLIVLESTRADALTLRWDGRPVAPNLAALAASGSHSDEAYSHAGFTRQSLRSLFTGRFDPASRGASLFDDFRRAGYRIGVFSGQAETFGGTAEVTGMREDADVFLDAKTLERERVWPFLRDINLLVDGRTLLRELDSHFGRPSDWRRPVFLYVNVQASHFPYSFPGALQLLPGTPIPRGEIGFANRDWVRRTYWNSVAYGDWQVGRIVARLKSLGVFDDGVLLVVGDHGEELFEHGYIGHGQRLDDLQTRIPFVLNRRDVVLPRPVGLADVRSLLLRAAGAHLGPPRAAGPVLQYIAEIDRPPVIAMVEAGRRRTSLDLDSERVSYEDSAGRTVAAPYRALAAGSPLKAKADRLVRLWERERWRRHLEQQGR